MKSEHINTVKPPKQSFFFSACCMIMESSSADEGWSYLMKTKKKNIKETELVKGELKGGKEDKIVKLNIWDAKGQYILDISGQEFSEKE